MCTPPSTPEPGKPTLTDIIGRNMGTGSGPGRPGRAGCASGTWLDSEEGRRWDSLTRPPARRSDKPGRR